MDYSALLLWTLLVWLCIHFLSLARKRSASDGKQLPPGPNPLPIVGSIFELGNLPNESLADLAKIYGPLMTVKLGFATQVVVSSAAIAEEVLRQNDQVCGGRIVVDAMRAVNFYESAIITSQPTPRWRKLRTICNTQMFTHSRLTTSQPLRQKKVQDLIAYLHDHGLRASAVDIGQAAFATTFNLMSNTIFSIDFVDLNSDSAEEFKNIMWKLVKEGGRPNIVDCFPFLRPIDPQGIRRRMTTHMNRVYAIFDGFITERALLRSSSDYRRRNDFLDVLLDQVEDNESELGRHDIKAVLLDLMLAGSDTSSTTVEWALAELLRNPDIMAKARIELKQTIGLGHHVEESDITRLPYLQAIVKETLRLHPPVPLVPRKTLANIEIFGFTMPKETWINVNIWAISRDPDVWADPTSFSPERFLGIDINFKGQNFELIPFGSGKRICPGLPLAVRMVHFMLASLLHSFDWKLPNGMMPQDLDMNTKFGVILQKASPLQAIPLIDD